MVMRGAKRKGVRYFGPFGHAYAIRETLDLLLRTFPIRTCSDNKFLRHQRQGRPCLLGHIEKCAAPCVGEIDKPAYDALVNELLTFLEGETDPIVGRLESDMKAAAATLEFERAARVRDRLASVRKAIERQQMVADKNENLDVIGIADDELEAAVQVFHVRKGRVVGRKGMVVDKVEDLTAGQLVEHILEALYAAAPAEDVPREVLVPTLPEDLELYEAFLMECRGARSSVRVPQRGAKRSLHATVTQNAKEAFTRHRLKRSTDHNSRAKALNAMQEALDLPDAPLRIECFDMSHIQGSDYVGSMVVMEDGLPKKSDYRKFKVREVPGNDDFAAMEEVLARRLSALVDERERPGDHRRRRFAYPPNLLLVDGGKGQLGVACRVIEELGLEGEISVAALAKRFEEVYVPGRADPVRIPRQSEALYLLQQIRDEAHRFAITYHRQLRNKRMTRSVLDDIPGLGPTRKKRLTKELGGVAGVKRATVEELQALPWLPDAVGKAVWERIHMPAPRPGRQPVPFGGADTGANPT
jgi:excinuclease ABC subunit C